MSIRTVYIVTLSVATTILIAITIAGVFIVGDRFSTDRVTSLNGSGQASVQYVSRCSGMDVSNPEVQLVAVSECMGRLRGFVDGHNMTVALSQLEGMHRPSLRLWCIAPTVTSNQLLTSVMDWVDTHTLEFDNITANSSENNSIMIVTVKALRAKYPCVTS